MDDVKQQVVDRLKQANNVLVTVRNNPSIDLLSACIGLALVLDKLDKHAAAVFSGEVPSAMEFLKPEETLEDTPNSLRDFIIALDKSKADKLRYKVEDKVVRIFITPYRTSLTQDDLQFSQGDFNIDAVVALGAHEQAELDQAVTEHGRILHDATVISINNTPNGNLGALSWQDTSASSLSEMIAQLVDELGKDKKVLDEQISTALLAGIVAETDRFSNDKTTPKTMSLAGELMAAGANQQLVATKLQEGGATFEGSNGVNVDGKAAAPANKQDDGTLDIAHRTGGEDGTDNGTAGKLPTELPKEPEPLSASPGRQVLPMPEPIQISDVHGSPIEDTGLKPNTFNDEEIPSRDHAYLVDQPMKRIEEPASNPFDLPPPVSASEPKPPTPPGLTPLPPEDPKWEAPLLSQPMPQNSLPPQPPVVPAAMPAATPLPSVRPGKDSQTLESIEESVDSPHLDEYPDHADAAEDDKSVDDARSKVIEALRGAPPTLTPRHDLNAAPFEAGGQGLHADEAATPAAPLAPEPPAAPQEIAVDAEGNLKTMSDAPPAALTMQLPQISKPAPTSPQSPATPLPPANAPASQPPAVPPPFTMPPNFTNESL